MRALPLTGVPGRMTRRLLAMTLIGQALAVFFGALVARQLAVADGATDQADTSLILGCVLAVLMVLISGMLRFPFGITLGWVAQLLTLASAIVLPAMLAIVVIFGGLWVVSLVQGHKMDSLTEQWAREAQEQPPTDEEN